MIKLEYGLKNRYKDKFLLILRPKLCLCVLACMRVKAYETYWVFWQI